MDKIYYVYILTSKRNGTLYTGMTGALARRIWQHKEGVFEGFTKKYDVKMLVWYDAYEDVSAAIQREKTIKKWPRRWKLSLIESFNPDWRDLFSELGPDM